nr:immunoglobulin heavy chain junction region [Mus musculus]
CARKGGLRYAMDYW